MAIILRIFLLFVFCLPCIKASAETEFEKYNPDVLKYEFTRSYISSLSYLSNINDRWKNHEPTKTFKGEQFAVIRANIEYLTADNTDLRVAKNYIRKYMQSPNLLMRKVADTYMKTCDQLIALNESERHLWKEFYDAKKAGNNAAAVENEFVRKQRQLALGRKEISKGFIEASIIATKVMLSQESDDQGTLKKLALTAAERDRLVKKIDAFARNNIDWGMKPGHTILEASIASIREVLEDSIWASADDPSTSVIAKAETP